MSQILRFCVGALLAFCWVQTWAAVPSSSMYRTGGSSTLYPTIEAACASRKSEIGWFKPTSFAYEGPTGSPPTWSCTATNASGGFTRYASVYGAGSQCPANSTASGASCVCSSGYVEKNGQCISLTDPDTKCATDFAMAGFGIGQGLGTIRDTKTMSGVVPSGEMCWPHESATSGCLVNFDRTGLTTMPDGSIQSSGSFSMYKGGVGGKACTLEPPQDPGSTVEEKCEQSGSYTDSKGTHSLCLDAPKCEGGFMGTVSYLGGEVCIKDKGGNVIETSKDTIKKNEDGSTDKVTEKTTCKGNTCTTEKTTTNTTTNNTSSSSTTTKTESKEDYCKANANAAQCKGDGKDDEEKEGSFGGSCQSGFTCEGDALQCAQLKEQHKRNCETMEKDTDANSLTNKALNGTDDKSAEALKASAGQVNVATSFDQSGFGWSRSCPSDTRIPLNFGGVSSEFSIPYSITICGPLGILSWAGVGITLLGCLVWVVGVKKGG